MLNMCLNKFIIDCVKFSNEIQYWRMVWTNLQENLQIFFRHNTIDIAVIDIYLLNNLFKLNIIYLLECK